jgi:16S rRNA (guanine(966)-N(2))-methyltransferase RsmD
MRVIAGELRGRKLAAPKGLLTRPMLDRVREAVFGSLGARVEDARVLDLFAGTGSLGIEALSRGAERAVLVERDPAVLAVLGENLRTLGLEGRSRVLRGNALDPWTWRRAAEALRGARFELVFLDPPYADFELFEGREKLMAALEALLAEHVAPGGLVVLHAPTRPLARLAEERGWRFRAYGSSGIAYVPAPEERAEAGGEAGA